MTRMEKAALAHVVDWKKYQRSPQYAADLRQSRAAREAQDIKAGHSPACSLTKCHPSCGRTVRSAA